MGLSAHYSKTSMMNKIIPLNLTISCISYAYEQAKSKVTGV